MKQEKAVLFGNGINRLSTHEISWSELLQTIKGKQHFENGALPNTMIYERAVLERPLVDHDVLANEAVIKNDIATKLKEMPPNDHYMKLFETGVKHFMSTNYDYAFNKSILEDSALALVNKSTEDLYSVRRKSTIVRDGTKDVCDIWNVHGEIDKPASIMLGLDHYCGSVGKIDAYVKGNYKYQLDGKEIRLESIQEKLKGSKPWDGISWVEYFFRHDVHILGLSLDYSETDLWWVLNRRARIMKSLGRKGPLNNKVFFYTTSIEEERKGLLESMNVVVVDNKRPSGPTAWKLHFTNVIDQIGNA